MQDVLGIGDVQGLELETLGAGQPLLFSQIDLLVAGHEEIGSVRLDGGRVQLASQRLTARGRTAANIHA